jgi:drug/metabolite transporter (DMT)-like permease
MPRLRAIVVLVFATAIWGVTFVQVKDAVALYPLFAFLALRFAIASCTLAPLGVRRIRTLGPGGLRASVLTGSLVAAGYVLQTAGLQRTSVSLAGFITGLQVVLTPLIALALFRLRIGVVAWAGVGIATVGLALLSGVQGGSVIGDLLVLAGAAAFALQIALMERYAPRYDAVTFTFVEMLAACAGLSLLAGALGDLRMPHGWTVWGALVVTGVFASALGFLAQTWAQRRATATQTALVYTVEPVWAAFFGFTLAGDRLHAAAWLGCILILAGIGIAEPVTAAMLARLARWPRLA